MSENTRNILIGVAVLLGIVVLCGAGWLLLTQPMWAANFRDILIIILAVESIAVFGFLGAMLWQLYQLIKLLRDEVIPLINTTKDTVEQVKTTTTFVGQSVAAPVISVSGFLAGTKAMVDTLRGINPPEAILRKDSDSNG